MLREEPIKVRHYARTVSAALKEWHHLVNQAFVFVCCKMARVRPDPYRVPFPGELS